MYWTPSGTDKMFGLEGFLVLRGYFYNV